jgi:hypothetical protein
VAGVGMGIGKASVFIFFGEEKHYDKLRFVTSQIILFWSEFSLND